MKSDEKTLNQEHSWILNPIENAISHICKSTFFEWVKNIDNPIEFENVATQIFHHSATLPKSLGLMLATTPINEGHFYQIYAKHIQDEAPHHIMLLEWMVNNKIINDTTVAYDTIPTIETNACINIGYEIALSRDHEAWITCMNCGIERAFFEFFSRIAPKMNELGVGHQYFDVHVSADAEHSVMGLDLIKPHDPDSLRGRSLIVKALGGLTLWSSMIHSWIGIQNHLNFDLQGNAIPIKNTQGE